MSQILNFELNAIFGNFEGFDANMLKKHQIHYPKSNLLSYTICKHRSNQKMRQKYGLCVNRDCYNFGECPH